MAPPSSIKVKLLRYCAPVLGLALLSLLIFAGISFNLSRSDWAAWVQAVGSIIAILVAVWVVRFQHQREQERLKEDARQLRRRQLSVLKWLYTSVAESCSNIRKCLGRPHVNWDLESEKLNESRRLLLNISLEQHPDPALIIRTQELAFRLQTAVKVVHSLRQPRSELIIEKVKQIVQSLEVDALTGMTEAATLLIRCSTSSELDADWSLIDKREENRDFTLRILKKDQLCEEG